MRSVCLVGTGLIGASIGLALREAGFAGEIFGYDTRDAEAEEARRAGAVSQVLRAREEVAACRADVTVLATPVLPILDWMERLAPELKPSQLVTDAGSTKVEIVARAARLFGGAGQAGFLPGHPMAGKESGGAALAEAGLFRGATWLFTPMADHPLAAEWRAWVEQLGAHVREGRCGGARRGVRVGKPPAAVPVDSAGGAA